MNSLLDDARNSSSPLTEKMRQELKQILEDEKLQKISAVEKAKKMAADEKLRVKESLNKLFKDNPNILTPAGSIMANAQIRNHKSK